MHTAYDFCTTLITGWQRSETIISDKYISPTLTQEPYCSPYSFALPVFGKGKIKVAGLQLHSRIKDAECNAQEITQCLKEREVHMCLDQPLGSSENSH